MDKGIVKIVTLEQFAQMPQAVAAWTGLFLLFQIQKTQATVYLGLIPKTLKIPQYDWLRIYL
jgi:hypothetical protein